MSHNVHETNKTNKDRLKKRKEGREKGKRDRWQTLAKNQDDGYFPIGAQYGGASRALLHPKGECRAKPTPNNVT